MSLNLEDLEINSLGSDIFLVGVTETMISLLYLVTRVHVSFPHLEDWLLGLFIQTELQNVLD